MRPCIARSDKSSTRPNDAPLCLLITSEARNTAELGTAHAADSIRCDVRIRARVTPYDNSSDLTWPVWKIVAVSVGGGAGLLLLLTLCCLCMYAQRLQNATIAPDMVDEGDDDPNAYLAQKKRREVGASPPVLPRCDTSTAQCMTSSFRKVFQWAQMA